MGKKKRSPIPQSPYRGIKWHGQINRWVIRRSINSNVYQLGSYHRHEDAVAALTRFLDAIGYPGPEVPWEEAVHVILVINHQTARGLERQIRREAIERNQAERR